MLVPLITSFYQEMNSSTPSLQDKLVYTDTSYVYELIGESKDPVRQKECRDFSSYLSNIGTVMVTSPKVHEELRIAIPRSIIAADRQYKSQPLKEVVRNNPGVFRRAKNELGRATAALKENPNFLHLDIVGFDCDYIENTIDPVFDSNDLFFPDAFHYAFAKSQEITVIASLDKDYINVNDPNLHIVTDTGNYLKILLERNIPVPQQVLEYYITQCNKFGFNVPGRISKYYSQILKGT